MENLDRIIREESYFGEGERTQEEKDWVWAEIESTRQICHAMGNNNTEYDELDNIWKEYEAGLNAKEAVRKARAIPGNKIQR